MVRVVIVGGSGNVGRSIVEEIVKQGKHQVTVFTCKDIPHLSDAGIEVSKIKDYHDEQELTAALHGVHTVLSFISYDTDNVAQKTLIAACIAAGVKRFAPSEWGIRSRSGFRGYAFKDEIHEHLKQINAEKPVLEFCLFQPGIFMNYLTYPLRTAEHLYMTCTLLDVQERQLIMVEYGETWYTFTTIQDTAKVVAAALGYEGKWPETGGIVGGRIKEKDLFALVERVKGQPFQRHVLKLADLEKGDFNSTWIPPMDHPNMPPEMKTPNFAKAVLPPFLVASAGGATDVPPVWNGLMPDVQLEDIEAYLRRVLEN